MRSAAVHEGRNRTYSSMHAARALIAAATGEPGSFRNHAEHPLEAASHEHSAFRYHPSVGLVMPQYDAVIKKLESLGAGDVTRSNRRDKLSARPPLAWTRRLRAPAPRRKFLSKTGGGAGPGAHRMAEGKRVRFEPIAADAVFSFDVTRSPDGTPTTRSFQR